MRTRMVWSNAVHTQSPSLSTFQSKPEIGCEDIVTFCIRDNVPATPSFSPSLSRMLRCEGYSLQHMQTKKNKHIVRVGIVEWNRTATMETSNNGAIRISLDTQDMWLWLVWILSCRAESATKLQSNFTATVTIACCLVVGLEFGLAYGWLVHTCFFVPVYRLSLYATRSVCLVSGCASVAV